MWTWDQEQKETSINKSFANAGKGVAILILGNIIAFVVLIILLKHGVIKNIGILILIWLVMIVFCLFMWVKRIKVAGSLINGTLKSFIPTQEHTDVTDMDTSLNVEMQEDDPTEMKKADLF